MIKAIDKKYHFDDVMIVPKPTQLSSRSQVKLDVSYVTKHSGRVISGFPMIVANMDTTGQIGVAKALYEHKTFVALHKYININDVAKFIGSEFSRYSFFSMGITEQDFNNLKYLVGVCKLAGKTLPMINMDVANGYMYSFLDAIKQVRDLCPNSIIMAGTVCTPEGVENIVKAGADIARCGIANGCFIAGTKVLTNSGYKSIEKIKAGDLVKTKNNRFKKVLGTKTRIESKTIMDVNGLHCTTNHPFYVVHKNDAHLVTDDNIHSYAKWVSAGELSDDYMLVSIQ